MEQAKAAAEEQRLLLEQKQLENDRLKIQVKKEKLELDKETIKVLKDFVNDFMPNVTEEERILYIMKFHPSVKELLALPEEIRLSKE